MFYLVLDDAISSNRVANPSIGEVSLGASLSLGSACHLEDRESSTTGAECDRESASNTAIAGKTYFSTSQYTMYNLIRFRYISHCVVDQFISPVRNFFKH